MIHCVVEYSRKGVSSTADYWYDDEVCIGETIRNLCVNIGIDPDTLEGVTRNVAVYRRSDDGEWKQWDYQPVARLADCATNSLLQVKIVPLFD